MTLTCSHELAKLLGAMPISVEKANLAYEFAKEESANFILLITTGQLWVWPLLVTK